MNGGVIRPDYKLENCKQELEDLQRENEQLREKLQAVARVIHDARDALEELEGERTDAIGGDGGGAGREPPAWGPDHPTYDELGQ